VTANLEYYRKQAKSLLKAARSGEAAARLAPGIKMTYVQPGTVDSEPIWFMLVRH